MNIQPSRTALFRTLLEPALDAGVVRYSHPRPCASSATPSHCERPAQKPDAKQEDTDAVH